MLKSLLEIKNKGTEILHKGAEILHEGTEILHKGTKILPKCIEVLHKGTYLYLRFPWGIQRFLCLDFPVSCIIKYVRKELKN